MLLKHKPLRQVKHQELKQSFLVSKLFINSQKVKMASKLYKVIKKCLHKGTAVKINTILKKKVKILLENLLNQVNLYQEIF